MTVTKDDFEKIWASSSPLTPYSFSDAQYKEGWNFVGATPPSRQMWDAFMQNADEKLKYLYQHEDIPLGHEYFTFNPNVPQGSLPLFGGEYSRETYADLWNWVQEQTGYLKTEAEWQTLSASNNGNVPYYSDGDGSTTFRVPSLKCWVKGANGTVSEVGSYLEAGLPNITGEVASISGYAGFAIINNPAGAINGITNTNYNALDHAGSSAASTANRGFDFDASRSNAIYGNSTTVQPKSIVGLWLVKAYGVIVDTGSIDEQAYIDDRFNSSKQYTDDKIAPIGTVVGNSASSATYTNGAHEALQITLPKGTWVITGHLSFTNASVGNVYGVGINDSVVYYHTMDGSVTSHYSSASNGLASQTTRILELSATTTIYLIAWSNANFGVNGANIKAVRII